MLDFLLDSRGLGSDICRILGRKVTSILVTISIYLQIHGTGFGNPSCHNHPRKYIHIVNTVLKTIIIMPRECGLSVIATNVRKQL